MKFFELASFVNAASGKQLVVCDYLFYGGQVGFKSEILTRQLQGLAVVECRWFVIRVRHDGRPGCE